MSSDPRDFREGKRAERARRIAQRIHAAGGVQNLQFRSLDAMCAPGVTGGWQVPEPKAEMLQHMADFGYAESDAAEGRAEPPERGSEEILNQDSATVADIVAAAVQRALAVVGIRAPASAASGNGPPRNEDR